MQWERAIAIIERRSARTWLALGVAGAVVPALLMALAPLTGDLALAALSVGSLGSAWYALRLKARLDQLPLEIAPVIGTGIVDGVRVYRFRVRLGRGRMVVLPVCTITYVDEHDDRRALGAEIPADELWGPFVIVVPDPNRAVGDDGRFEVRVACEAGGKHWETRQVLSTDAIRDGWFGGIALSGGTVRFEGDWTELIAVPELSSRLR